MDFRIVEELNHPARKQVGLFIKHTDTGLCQLMIMGGDLIEVEQTYHCVVDHSGVNLLKWELEKKEGELRFLELIHKGAMGYLHQRDYRYGTTTTQLYFDEDEREWVRVNDTRGERIDQLRKYIGEIRAEVLQCQQIHWLLDAGAELDKKFEKEKKQAWLRAVRSQERSAQPGTQSTLF